MSICLSVYVHTHVHPQDVGMYVGMHACVYVGIPVCICQYVSACISFVWKSAGLYVCMKVCMSICTETCMCAGKHACIHTVDREMEMLSIQHTCRETRKLGTHHTHTHTRCPPACNLQKIVVSIETSRLAVRIKTH